MPDQPDLVPTRIRLPRASFDNSNKLFKKIHFISKSFNQ